MADMLLVDPVDDNAAVIERLKIAIATCDECISRRGTTVPEWYRLLMQRRKATFEHLLTIRTMHHYILKKNFRKAVDCIWDKPSLFVFAPMWFGRWARKKALKLRDRTRSNRLVRAS